MSPAPESQWANELFPLEVPPGVTLESSDGTSQRIRVPPEATEPEVRETG